MELLFSNPDFAVCIKPVGLDSEHQLPAALTEALGGDALRGKDMLLALDGEDSPYLTKSCLLKDTDTPVAEQVQKLFVLDKNNMASPETAKSE